MSDKFDIILNKLEKLEKRFEESVMGELALKQLTDIKKENTSLKTEVERLKLIIDRDINCKKFVIYGFPEYSQHRYNKQTLFDDIGNYIFNSFRIDLHGYIEDIYRIGKYSHKRPLVVELLSKRMVKHVLQASQTIQNNNYSSRIRIGEFLTPDRYKQQRENYMKPRDSRPVQTSPPSTPSYSTPPQTDPNTSSDTRSIATPERKSKNSKNTKRSVAAGAAARTTSSKSSPRAHPSLRPTNTRSTEGNALKNIVVQTDRGLRNRRTIKKCNFRM